MSEKSTQIFLVRIYCMNIPFKKFYFYNSIVAAAMHACIEHHHYQQHGQSRFQNLTESTTVNLRIPILSYPLLSVANALTLIYFKGENISSQVGGILTLL